MTQPDAIDCRPNAPMVAFAGFLRTLRASPRWSKVARLMILPGDAPDHTEDQSS